MWKRALGFGLVAMVVSFAPGCADDDGDQGHDGTGEVEQNAVGAQAPSAGEAPDRESEQGSLICGGIAGKKCPPGYQCTGKPPYPDATGKCVEVEEPALFCGGIAGRRCPEGYRCILSGNYPDAGGRCVRSDEGGGSGGFPKKL